MFDCPPLCGKCNTTHNISEECTELESLKGIVDHYPVIVDNGTGLAVYESLEEIQRKIDESE